MNNNKNYKKNYKQKLKNEEFISSNNDKNICGLFYGPPGIGKTFYIKSKFRNSKKYLYINCASLDGTKDDFYNSLKKAYLINHRFLDFFYRFNSISFSMLTTIYSIIGVYLLNKVHNKIWFVALFIPIVLMSFFYILSKYILNKQITYSYYYTFVKFIIFDDLDRVNDGYKNQILKYILGLKENYDHLHAFTKKNRKVKKIILVDKDDRIKSFYDYDKLILFKQYMPELLENDISKITSICNFYFNKNKKADNFLKEIGLYKEKIISKICKYRFMSSNLRYWDKTFSSFCKTIKNIKNNVNKIEKISFYLNLTSKQLIHKIIEASFKFIATKNQCNYFDYCQSDELYTMLSQPYISNFNLNNYENKLIKIPKIIIDISENKKFNDLSDLILFFKDNLVTDKRATGIDKINDPGYIRNLWLLNFVLNYEQNNDNNIDIKNICDSFFIFSGKIHSQCHYEIIYEQEILKKILCYKNDFFNLFLEYSNIDKIEFKRLILIHIFKSFTFYRWDDSDITWKNNCLFKEKNVNGYLVLNLNFYKEELKRILFCKEVSFKHLNSFFALDNNNFTNDNFYYFCEGIIKFSLEKNINWSRDKFVSLVDRAKKWNFNFKYFSNRFSGLEESGWGSLAIERWEKVYMPLYNEILIKLS